METVFHSNIYQKIGGGGLKYASTGYNNVVLWAILSCPLPELVAPIISSDLQNHKTFEQYP
jgi:hypothetical protein